MLGISVYFQDLNEDYLREAAKCHAKYIMTSLQIPEEDYSRLDQQLPRFLELINELDMELIPDVSNETFHKLNLPQGDFMSLKEKGFHRIRLDYGFDDIETLKYLLAHFEIVLNASVVSEELLKQLVEADVDMSRLMAMHNFYPRQDTGLIRDDFIKKNQLLHQYGMKVQAFVCGDDIKRFPLYEGLPTLEDHRELHPLAATMDLMKNCDIDDAFIGDSQAQIATLKAMSAYMYENKILLPCYLNKDYQYLYQQTLSCRKESSPHVVRITTPRIKGISPRHNQYRYKGAITIDNELMGRYCGEVQIMKQDMPLDARCNVIGFVHPEYLDILSFIDSLVTIELIEIS